MICVCMHVSGRDIKMIKSPNVYLHPSTINTIAPAHATEIRSIAIKTEEDGEKARSA